MQKSCSKFLINIRSCCSYLFDSIFFIKQVLISIKHQTKFPVSCKLVEHIVAKKTKDEARVNIEVWPGAQLQMSVSCCQLYK